MKEVDLQTIERAVGIIDHLDDAELETVTEKYSLEQSDLIGYLLTAVDDYKNENLTGYIIYYFCLIMEAFNQAKIPLRKVQINDIEDLEKDFTKMLDAYFDTEDQEIIESFTEQATLVQFMLIEISTDDEDGSSFDEELATQIFIVSTAMIA